MYLFIYSYLKCISDISIPYYFIEMFRFWNSLGLNVGLIFISSFSPFHLINSQLRHYYLREIFPDPTPYPQTKLIILSYTVSGCSLIFHYRINHIVFFFFFFLAEPRSMRDLSSPTRDQTQVPCSGIGES